MLWTIRLVGGLRRVNHAAVVIGDKIYSFGGYCAAEDFDEWLPIQIHVLDTSTLRWSDVEYENVLEGPFQRYGHTVVAYGYKVYLWGGRNNSTTCNTLYEFDTKTLKWSTPEVKGYVQFALDGHSACIIDDKMYVFGGYEYYTEQYSQNLYMLDLKTFTWKNVPIKGKPPSHRDFHSAVPVGKRMYVFGGRGDLNGPYNSQEEMYGSEVYYFDTETRVWHEPKVPGDWPEGRRSQSAWFYKDYIYIFGGYNDNEKAHYNDIWRFSVITNTWQLLNVGGETPSVRRRQCCILFEDKVYLFGGSSPLVHICPESEETIVDTVKLVDNDDLIILDYSPSLKTLAMLTVIDYELDTSCLPNTIKIDLENMTKPNNVRTPRYEMIFRTLRQLLN